ncbi:hypothetical protein K6119_16585 [Paracrocinitomix mangrovi]|uniref:hypothetical protein n=1 Tax=Paracrocinitomix mangrovi TaxID=2862509 RepID=UPI001C8E5DB7|nr:hypothetical protein [Paracrocinitomix mangrovi]UKN01345.1 hypothetical protein K6119_16585 [Paracrocinitomix mangrovi]
MRYFISIVTIFLMGHTLYSQRSYKFEFGIHSAHSYSYRHLTYQQDTSGIYETIVSNRDSMENAAFRNEIGIDFTYFFCNKFGLSSAINYRMLGYTFQGTFISAVPSGQMQVLEFKQKEFHHFIEIPLMITYQSSFPSDSRRFGIELNAGISNNLYLNSTNYLSTNPSSIFEGKDKTSIFDRYFLGLNFNPNFQFYLLHARNAHFEIGPEFKMGITTAIDAPIREYLYTIGLKIGLST